MIGALVRKEEGIKKPVYYVSESQGRNQMPEDEKDGPNSLRHFMEAKTLLLISPNRRANEASFEKYYGEFVS